MGVADLPKAWVEAAARLQISLGRVADEMQQRRELMEARIPKDVPFGVGGVFPASGFLLLQLSKPDAGRVQQLRRIVVGGANATDTPAGTGYLFVIGQPPLDLGLTGMVDSTATPFPVPAQYGTHEVPIRFPDALWCAIVGGTSGHTYNVTGEVEDFDERIYAGFIE